MLLPRPIAGLFALFVALSWLGMGVAPGAAQSTASYFATSEPQCEGMLVDEECKSEKDVIKLVQATLNAAGCDVGPVDGVMGRRTHGWLKVHDTIWKDVSYRSLFEDKRGDDLLVRVELLSGMVCNRAYQMSGECQAAYDKWKRAPGAGAFAVSGLGGCASASGYESVSAAKSAVLARCSKNGTSCRIQDTKGGRGSSSLGSPAACSAADGAYQSLSGPKALVEGSNGCYIFSAGSTRLALKSRALRYCRSKGGRDCRVVDAR